MNTTPQQFPWGTDTPTIYKRCRSSKSVLSCVGRKALTPEEIAERSGVDKRVVTSTLKYLEQEGRVDLGPDKNGEPTYVRRY